MDRSATTRWRLAIAAPATAALVLVGTVPAAGAGVPSAIRTVADDDAEPGDAETPSPSRPTPQSPPHRPKTCACRTVGSRRSRPRHARSPAPSSCAVNAPWCRATWRSTGRSPDSQSIRRISSSPLADRSYETPGLASGIYVVFVKHCRGGRDYLSEWAGPLYPYSTQQPVDQAGLIDLTSGNGFQPVSPVKPRQHRRHGPRRHVRHAAGGRRG